MIQRASPPAKRAVILNGARNGEHDVALVQGMLESELHAGGWDVEPYHLARLDMESCRKCYGCWRETRGVCVVDDDGRSLAGSVVSSDLAIMLTPVTFGGCSDVMRRGVGRLSCLASPNFTRVNGIPRHTTHYPRQRRLLAIGILAEQDEESFTTFLDFVARFSARLDFADHTTALFMRQQTPTALHSGVTSSLTRAGVR